MAKGLGLIDDWVWRPEADVANDLGLTKIPDYITNNYGRFMEDQLSRANRGDIGARDLLKAYGITRSSVGRTSRNIGGQSYRPEGFFSDWLLTPEGQKYLNDAEVGKVNNEAIANAVDSFKPFGMADTLGSDLKWGAENLSLMEPNSVITGDVSGWRDFAQSLPGIGPAKSGFIASLLGRGDLPTLDARQIKLQTGAPSSEASKYMRRQGGKGGDAAVDRLAQRQENLGLEIDPALKPQYQHLTHHAIWDKVAGSNTTHSDLVNAMQKGNADPKALATLAAGGGLAMALPGLFDFQDKVRQDLQKPIAPGIPVTKADAILFGAEMLPGAGIMQTPYDIEKGDYGTAALNFLTDIPGVNLLAPAAAGAAGLMTLMGKGFEKAPKWGKQAGAIPGVIPTMGMKEKSKYEKALSEFENAYGPIKPITPETSQKPYDLGYALENFPAFRRQQEFRNNGIGTPTVSTAPPSLMDPLPFDISRLEGQTLMGIRGDSSVAGLRVPSHVGGVPIDNPIDLTGGHEFPYYNQGTGDAWGANLNTAKRFQNNVDRIGNETGGDPIGIGIMMDPRTSPNFSHMPTGLWLNQLRSLGTPPEVLQGIVNDVRTLKGGNKNFLKREDGTDIPLDSQEAYDYLMSTKPGAGKDRTRLMEAASKVGHQIQGSPSILDIQDAVIDPRFRSWKADDAGAGFTRLHPGRPVTPGQHESYDTNIPGDYMMHDAPPLHVSEWFPDFWKSLDGEMTKTGKPLTTGQKANKVTSNYGVYQKVTPMMVDRISGLLGL